MQEKEFKLANMTLRGLAFGDPEKPMILALHGWLDNAASFIPIADFLADYYVIAIDLVGHGLSDHRGPDNHYNLMDYVYDIHELAESQGWDNFILLGHSMGGIIGSIYTSCFPEKVSRYISIESFGPISKDADTSPQHLRESIESRLKVGKSVGKHPSSLDNTIQARVKAGDLNLESATLLVTRNVQQVEDGLRFRTDRRLRTISALRVTPDQAEAFIRGISRPTLVINGDKGYERMKALFNERRAWLSYLTSAECAGGHHLHMEEPKAVATCIIDFLNQPQDN